MPDYFKIGQGNQWLRPVSATCDFRISHGTANSFGDSLLFPAALPCFQSQKTQGFCVADFATLSDERRSRSKIFPLFIWIKNLAFENLKGSNVRNFLGFRKLFYIYDFPTHENKTNDLILNLTLENMTQHSGIE